MTTFPGSPRTLQGAIIGLDPFNPLASVVVFQYNPERMQRSLQIQAAGGATGGTTGAATAGDRSEVLRLSSAPVESITLEVEIDATDQLETGDPLASGLGIYPQLA